MGKRKASSSGDDLPKTTTASGNSSLPDTEIVAKMKEHREYLLAQVGLTPEDVDTPPAKKCKINTKKITTEDNTDTPRDVDSTPDVAKTAVGAEKPDNDVATPEVASPPKRTKSKAKPKSKKSEAIELDQAGPSSAHDSALSSDHDHICIKTKLTDHSEPQERTKRTKSTSTKRIRLAPGSQKPAEAELEPSHQPAPLTKLVKAKILRIHDFIQNGHMAIPVFLPEKVVGESKVIEIPSRTLAGVLKRLYIDYQLGDPETAHLAELEMCITDRFTDDVKACPDQGWVRVDLSLLNEVEVLEEIRRKVKGCGLDDVNLLEVEIAMMEWDLLAQHGLLEDGEGSRVSPPDELQSGLDETLEDLRSRDEIAVVSETTVAMAVAV
ncbi:hypothetical protein LTR78_009796 [Recurvomyces mirabilis]|uniref:Uncharacterized protein n=1 Tax=Recurvomyces mirabilis TaxID=574656 RepID=A0AAE0WH88_9PEZI|nr:hypothetical protein LTR78_009796 [Recurvomyces mirabilis]KAK5158213.1 hypothetical protein LTS14_003231 [Recurvomyces mirabilis]